MTLPTLILDHVYAHEAELADLVFLSQPVGGGEVIDITWAEALDQSRRMAAHLQSLGFAPGAHIAMLSKNCAHFILAELAIWMAGYTTVAIFPTETAETVRYVLEHSESSLLFIGTLDNWPRQKPGVPAHLPCIALPLAPATDFGSWDRIVASTPPLTGRPGRKATDLAMLIYTSGSTGTPKGVMVSFESYTHASEGISQDTRARGGQDADNRMLSYLPLAHSFERSWVEGSALADGRTHLYFTESLDTFLRDLRRARPTLFISVPRLWLKFQQEVFRKMPPARLDRLLSIPLLGRIVARKVRRGLGLDAVVLAGSGSAPAPAGLIAWYRRIGLALYEGYGMTEDSSYSHTSNAQFNAAGYVGVPLPGVAARISPEGEVLIKSPGRLSGYYKRPDLDAESFTDDGYFRTGDLGEQRPDGLLKITGRAKELFKTTKGEYVAPAPIESELNAHPMVELSLVAGVGQPAPHAMVLLAEDLRLRHGDPAVRAQVQGELECLREQVNLGLPDYAKLRMIVVVRELWSIENGYLTPTMKIRRARVEAAMATEVERWYADGRTVQWA